MLQAYDPPDEPQFQSLMAALEAKKGDFAAALTAMGLHLELNSIGEVTAITDPMLNGNFDDEEFALLSQIPALERIWLRGVEVTDDGLVILEKMPQLNYLSLEADQITDKGLIHLQHLPNLETLHLEHMRIDGSGLKHLPNADKLKGLDLTDSSITDGGLKHVSRFKNLTSLSLWGTAITDAGLVHLKSLTKLETLSLYETAISNAGIHDIVALPLLSDLDLSETEATDGCLESLLEIKTLKNVSFGSEQISVSTFERLQNEGIEVGHGQLLNVRRVDNLLRYVGMDFEVDRERSAIRAYIHPDHVGVHWSIDIECTEMYVPDHMQPAHLESPSFSSAGNWKDLTGEEFIIDFKERDLHPILPGNPGNIYVGWHAAPNNHRISFLKRTANRFLIDWKCEAKETENDNGEPVWVSAEIPFKEVVVWSERRMPMEEIQLSMRKYFDPTDFEPPIVEDAHDGTRATFRIRSSSE